MRQIDLKALVGQLEYDQLRKKDYVVPNSALSMEGGDITLSYTGTDAKLKDLLHSAAVDLPAEESANRLILNPTEIALGQLREKFRIPAEYFKRLQADHQGLLDYTVSYFLRGSNKASFIRTFEGDAGAPAILRAVLSDRFRTIDHLDVLMTALDTIKDMGVKVKIETCDLTDKKMYVRFYSPDIEVEAKDLLNKWTPPRGDKPKRIPKQGDGIISGFVLTNSEVGYGQFSISPRAIILACDNGMIRAEDSVQHIHLGAKMETGIKWSEETQQKNMELVASETRDAVRTYLSKDYLEHWVNEIRERNVELKHPVEAVNNVCKFAGLTEEKTKSIVNYFVQSADRTSFGLSQALTWFAQETGADEQYELEIAAEKIGTRTHEFDRATLN